MKKIYLTIVVLLMLIILYSLVWYNNRNDIMNEYSQGLEKITSSSMYSCDDDDYVINLKLPDFFTLTGNSCIATPDGRVAFLIWYSPIGENEYGIQISTSSQGRSEIVLNYMTDSKGNPLEELEPQEIALIEDYHEEINTLVEKARKYM